MGGTIATRPFEGKESIPLADGYELDLRPRRLRRGNRTLKLERIPLEILFLLVEHAGDVVSRDQIVSRIWGDDVFLDTDNSIRGAIRKLRQVLKDNAETPRFIQTVTGQGYRFIAPVANAVEPAVADPAIPGRYERSRRRSWFGASAALALVCVFIALVALRAWRRPSESPTATRKTVLAILPFENLSGDPGQDFFTDGLTEEMIA